MAAVMVEMSQHHQSHSQSPPGSPSRTKQRPSNLSIDLSDLPALSQPTPPSNTLLITNLEAPEIFAPSNLATIHQVINEQAAVYAFSPIKSFRRIICTFYNTDDAIRIRQLLDGESVLNCRVRVYFGVETKIDPEDQHLKAPKSEKQFLISPPPSPPMGWEIRQEDPPNTEVHADDLATALARLSASAKAYAEQTGVATAIESAASSSSPSSSDPNSTASQQRVARTRSGTASVVVYDPQDHGHSPDLPAIAVEDTSETPENLTPMDEEPAQKFVHTSRPPVELMH